MICKPEGLRLSQPERKKNMHHNESPHEPRRKDRSLRGSVIVVATALLLLSLWLLPATAGAHGPSEVALSYDSSQGTLTVTITHSVRNPSSHYIDEVSIAKNGEALESHAYESQPDRASFAYTYAVEAQTGDEITVRAGCNRFGSRQASLTVP